MCEGMLRSIILSVQIFRDGNDEKATEYEGPRDTTGTDICAIILQLI